MSVEEARLILGSEFDCLEDETILKLVNVFQSISYMVIESTRDTQE